MKRLMTRREVQETMTYKILDNIVEEHANGFNTTITELTVFGWNGFGYMSKVELEKEYFSTMGEEIEPQD